MKAPLIGISRHRLTTDGKGVTTLVAFHGCPLRCRYCLNSHCLRPDGVWQRLSADEILEQVAIDDLYFRATCGGVCFGGGEPLLRPDYLIRFRELCGADWQLTLETSLNVPEENLQAVLPHVNAFIVDIKDLHPEIYQQYTGQPITRLLRNLEHLAGHFPSQQVVVRVPLIPDYNTDDDRAWSVEQLQAYGFERFDRFTYRTDLPSTR